MATFQRIALLLLLLLPGARLMTQNTPSTMPIYEAAWKTIDSLEQEGLPRSALEKVEALQKRARRDEAHAQIVKTTIYRNKFRSQLEEEGMAKAIQRLERETKAASFPVQPVLHSVLGELYMQYLRVNLYRIRQRSDTQGYLSEDLKTWSVEQLSEAAAGHYLRSLGDPRTFGLPISEWTAITQNNEAVKHDLRPTLYDLLAHRALDFFTNENSFLNQPAYQFVLRQPAAFAPAEEFVRAEFASRDSSAYLLRSLHIFQDLLKRRLEAGNLPALVDADLRRLQFVQQQSVQPQKDSLYRAALQRMQQAYAETEEVAQVWYYQAKDRQRLGQAYDPSTDSTHRWKLKEAVEICEKAIEAYPESYGAKRCKILLEQINRRSASLQMEAVNLPEQPMLASLSYRNISGLNFRIIRLTARRSQELQGNRPEELFQELRGKEALQSWSATLPNAGDRQSCRTEIPLDGLPLGHYALLFSTDDGFNRKEQEPFGTVLFAVSEMGYFYQQQNNLIMLAHRENGKPLPGVEASLYQYKYNQRKREQEAVLQTQLESDENGMIKFPAEQQRVSFIHLKRGEDELIARSGPYGRRSYSRLQQDRQTEFFLDRAIYRPGQAIYFKALAMEVDEEGVPGILPNKKLEVTLYDANQQVVEKAQLRTNAYGTANGVFTAPAGGLLGNMRLESSIGNSSHTFSVEEYKRPKFELELQPLEGKPKLGDTIEVSGLAKAYAGNTIDGATVDYRVVRQVRFPWGPWWRSLPPYRGESQEMAAGRTTTDAQGQFRISFPALPDQSVPQDLQPEFTYLIYVDVTDLTGETQSASDLVRLAYLSVKTDAHLPGEADVQAGALPVQLVAQNLDGQALPKAGQVKIHRLQSPGRFLRDRYWNAPDFQLLSREAFEQRYPRYAYLGGNEPQNWSLAEMVWEQTVDTGKSDSLSVDCSGWEVGHYRLEFTVQDESGEDVKVRKFFFLYDSEEGKVPPDVLLWASLEQDEPYRVGEEARLRVATGADRIPFLFSLESRRKLLRQEWQTASPWQRFAYTVQDSDRGDFYMFYTGLQHNRAITEAIQVKVPWRDKKLNITYGTFRDKLKPGQEESWRLTISGPDKEKVAAEMVATLYDASLDAFRRNRFPNRFYPTYHRVMDWKGERFQGVAGRSPYAYDNYYMPKRPYRELNWFGWSAYGVYRSNLESRSRLVPSGAAVPAADAAMFMDKQDSAAEGPREATPPPPPEEEEQAAPPPVRRNLKETVFFYPELRTDEAGNIVLEFTMNEALTRWKFLAFAHSQDLQYATTEREVVTQKKLMVQPNPPRFLREGDRLRFPAKVSNLADTALAGTAHLQLFDAITMEPIDKQLGNTEPEQAFEAAPGQSATLYWEIEVPKGFTRAIVHRVRAQAGDFSDGEEAPLPVLTNRTLVTESLPLPVKGQASKSFTFEAMDKAKQSKTLEHHQFTLEFTSNPAWYAVKALPYLMEYPHDCSEQIFSRYYANSLATTVANEHPSLKRVFEQWRNTDAVVSELAQNQELKNILLEQTPWVLEAQSEEAQRKRIGLLFDLNRMAQEQATAVRRLQEMQASSGGFPWFAGGRESWYITQYILEGMGRLQRLGVAELEKGSNAYGMAQQAATYVDAKLADYFERLSEEQKEAGVLPSLAIHHLYVRSLFPDLPLAEQSEEAQAYFLEQARKQWLKQGLYEQGLLAAVFHTRRESASAEKIIRSLRERALYDEEQGMYWKYNTGYYWYQLPIETHAMMIEVFATVAEDAEAVEQLKVWLLKNKQANHWKTTKATASAVYALLHYGSNWLEETRLASVEFPELPEAAYSPKLAAAKESAEAGTGYFKTSWDGESLGHGFSKIKVENPNEGIAWGAAYWQYFEDLDKVKGFRETPLTLDKQLFREAAGEEGPVLQLITPEMELQPGDKIVARIELRVDRDMEYVHLRDLRASGLEPINVLSRYKYQDGLGYYESTRDASTDFFIEHLPKGTYVFEYPMWVVHRGQFSNGMAQIQCMYAPEFSSHSEGAELRVGE